MSDYSGLRVTNYSGVQKIACIIPISNEILMDEGLIPDTRPPRPPIPRRTRLRWWWRGHLSAYALRERLSAWIDPDPYKNEPR